ncbi:MAG: RagB/SusD family nutrient uptake outer membrane protein [Mangrovibacterium sp.]
MRNKINHIILIFIFVAAILPSCNFLDKQPSSEMTADDVWNSWANTTYYYNDTYNYLRNGLARINSSWMDAATDIAETSYSYGGTRKSFNVGNFYATEGAGEIKDTWAHYYKAIRKVNLFLENINNVPKDAGDTQATCDAKKARMIAEMRFFRAYFFWELTLRYGAIPIIDQSIDPMDDEAIFAIQRPNDISEGVQWVLNELQDCYFYLTADSDVSDSDKGMITKGANLALQARIKLYMASPLYADLGVANWQDAADASKIFIDNFGQGMPYALYQPVAADASAYQYAINRRVVGGNTEVIFWRNDASGNWWEAESPVGFGGTGGLCPSQNLVDMYDMANGESPFDGYDETGAPIYSAAGIPNVNSDSGYSEKEPYANRDPRMYATVLYHGAMWWNRAIDVSTGGSDNPTGNPYATPTGYYSKKYKDDTQTNYLDEGAVMYRNWIFIRYAELLLNYAEAMNELNGPSSEVFDALQQIRNRVGMTADLSSRKDLQSKESLRNFIRKERTIELAFEDHRWWDVRRWKVAERAIARPIYGMKVTKNDGTINYERKVAQYRVFENRFYLYPLPEENMWQTNWNNNTGW